MLIHASRPWDRILVIISPNTRVNPLIPVRNSSSLPGSTIIWCAHRPKRGSGWCTVVVLQCTTSVVAGQYSKITRSQLITEYVVISSPCMTFVRYIKWHECRSQLGSFYCFEQGNIADYSSTNGEDKTNAKPSRRQPSFLGYLPAPKAKNSLKRSRRENVFFYTDILPSCSFPISQFKYYWKCFVTSCFFYHYVIGNLWSSSVSVKYILFPTTSEAVY